MIAASSSSCSVMNSMSMDEHFGQAMIRSGRRWIFGIGAHSNLPSRALLYDCVLGRHRTLNGERSGSSESGKFLKCIAENLLGMIHNKWSRRVEVSSSPWRRRRRRTIMVLTTKAACLPLGTSSASRVVSSKQVCNSRDNTMCPDCGPHFGRWGI